MKSSYYKLNLKAILAIDVGITRQKSIYTFELVRKQMELLIKPREYRTLILCKQYGGVPLILASYVD